ncbi:MAG TPA: hypothetical protein VGU74_03565 [Gemmatimonadales bacterium]|nr:hypothetical protein [Gemmatimonadales bacterium]
MRPAARSLFVFGIYAVLAGLGLVLMPAVLLQVLQFPTPADGWVRVVGVLAICVGAYHILAARLELLPYIRATVPVRIAFALGLTALVLTRAMPAPLLIFGLVDVLGAAWTGLALRGADPAVGASAA